MARQDQPTVVAGWNADIDHLNRGELFHDRVGRKPRSMNLQAILQGHLQTISKKGHEDMRFDTTIEAMINRSQSEIAFECAECSFDLGQLDIASPQHRRVFGGEIGTQQIMPVAVFGLAEFHAIHLDAESSASDWLTLGGDRHLDEAEGASSFFLRGSDA